MRLRLVEWWGTNCPPARRTFAVMNTGDNKVLAGGELQAAAERKENIAISSESPSHWTQDRRSPESLLHTGQEIS